MSKFKVVEGRKLIAHADSFSNATKAVKRAIKNGSKGRLSISNLEIENAGYIARKDMKKSGIKKIF